MNIEIKEKRERLHKLVRMILYMILMVFSYIFMLTLRTGTALPSLLVPLAVCFAMREQPFGTAVFAAVCGLMSDSAFSVIPGLHAVFLMWLCLLISLLVNNVLRRSFFNFLLFELVTSGFMSFMRYVVLYGIDPSLPRGLIMKNIFVPEFIYTNIAALVLYFLTYLIDRNLGDVSEHYIEEKSTNIVRE
ncbi:MAG: hypothetical protein J6F31_01050 [Oscillospiraceae bacterium]|nr:hypothetical protein [Oscillospiraceae bacterium]